MGYIYRELQNKISSIINVNSPKGLILSGVVGCGKTTLVEQLLTEMASRFEVFSFTGDDIQFRQQVATNTRSLLDLVKSKTSKPALIFVDEVQKTEEVFDALKMAFDKGAISFIVSGSNPAYLSTIAKKRLQRRAEQIYMLPLSLNEIFCAKGYLPANLLDQFHLILWLLDHLDQLETPKVSLTPEMENLATLYFVYGGFPLPFLAQEQEAKLREIRLIVERGFELMSIGNNAVSELIKIELAQLQSQEFTYKNILERTRLRKRDSINTVIDDLINHGYVVKKKPFLFSTHKTSYLSVFSYIDPGIVSYLTGNYQLDQVKGSRVEGYVHARLSYLALNSVHKTDIGYYKPHDLDSRGNLRYLPGEIDFVVRHGKRLIPIEVKSTNQRSEINVSLLIDFVKEKKCPFGVVLYGGAPSVDRANQILYWPYWMI